MWGCLVSLLTHDQPARARGVANGLASRPCLPLLARLLRTDFDDDRTTALHDRGDQLLRRDSARVVRAEHVIKMAAEADEPADKNFVRKHALEQAEAAGVTLREAATRVFSNAAGSYSANAA